MTNCRREREGSRRKSTQVESVTEGRHRKRFVAHRGRRDSVRGAEGESHFRRLRNSNKSRAFALFFFGVRDSYSGEIGAPPAQSRAPGPFHWTRTVTSCRFMQKLDKGLLERRLLTIFSFALGTHPVASSCQSRH